MFHYQMSETAAILPGITGKPGLLQEPGYGDLLGSGNSRNDKRYGYGDVFFLLKGIFGGYILGERSLGLNSLV